MRYIVFTRVSTDKQKVENQVKECRLYIEARRKDSDQVFEFAEPETSSRIPMGKRPVLQEMLKFTKKADVLVIYKLDRLARNGQDLVNIYCDLQKKGVTIYSIYEPTADESFVHVYAFVAMKERESIKLRTISGMNRKRSNFERVGAIPYGYKLNQEEFSPYKSARSEGKPYKLTPDEKQFEASCLMFQWHKEGLSYQQIANELNAQGYTNQSGNPLQKMTVYRVLQRKEMYNQTLAV